MLLLCGVAALFGAEMLTYTCEPVTGWAGLGLALVVAPLFTGILAVPAWANLALGIWVVARFRPLEVGYLPDDRAAEGPSRG